MSGSASKKRRKQQRSCRPTQQLSPGDVCPLYRFRPGGDFYQSWLECGGAGETLPWADIATGPARASGQLDAAVLARRLPYYAAIYGRQVPVEAAWQLDQYIEDGTLPVQWTGDDPITQVPVPLMAPPLTSGSAAQARHALHRMHALCCLIIAGDGIVIPLEPGEPGPVPGGELAAR